MKRFLPAFIVLFFAFLAFSAVPSAPSGYAHDVITTPITWNREISRIFFDRCSACHREDGRAFPMRTYAQARPWAVAIKEEVLSRRMPPWGAVRGFGEFRNDQSLTLEQLELITSWVDGGVPEGDPKDKDEKDKKEPPPVSQEARGSPSSDPIRVKGDFALTRPFVLDGLLPESAPDKTSMQITAELPDGSVMPLLWLYEYKPAFSHPFLLKTPLELPARTVIRGVPPGVELVLLPH